MRHYFKWISLVFMCTALFACSSPHSPKGVAKSFWDGVLVQDETQVRQYTSTATQAKVDFSKNKINWSGMSVKLGSTDMMGHTAVVHTQIQDNNTGLHYAFATHLVQENGVWKVDYVRTRHASLTSEIFAGLIHDLQRLNLSLDKDFEGTMEGFKEAAPELKRELESLSDRFANHMQPATAGTPANPAASGAHKKLEDLKHAILGIFEHHAQTNPAPLPATDQSTHPTH